MFKKRDRTEKKRTVLRNRKQRRLESNPIYLQVQATPWPLHHSDTHDFRPTLDRYIERLSSDCRPSVDRRSTECWPITDRYIGQVSTNYRRSVGEVSVNEKLYRPRYIWNDYRPTIHCVSTECRPTIVRVSTDYRPLYRPSVDRLSTAISNNRSVDTTYSKHYPFRLARIFRFCEICWEYRTAGHLVFSTRWPVTGQF